MNQQVVIELLLQSLEHEQGGIKVYETALQCVQNDDLKEEFQKYLEQTRNHEQILIKVCNALEIDPETKIPAREVVSTVGNALVEAMKKAKAAGNPDAAEIVACECVVLAETKDHLDWELIGQLADKGKGDGVEALQDAYDEVEDQEDEHLYHSKGWCRELWLKAPRHEGDAPAAGREEASKTMIGYCSRGAVAQQAVALFSSRKRDTPASKLTGPGNIAGLGGAELAVTGEDWQRQVAIAAYQRWLARGGVDGDDQADWYAAEADLRGSRAPTSSGRSRLVVDLPGHLLHQGVAASLCRRRGSRNPRSRSRLAAEGRRCAAARTGSSPE